MCAVCPVSLPTGRCRALGITTRYEARKSVYTMTPVRYPRGSALQSRWAVAPDRSPRTIASTRRVLASRATHTHRTSALEPTKLHNSSASITTGALFFWRPRVVRSLLPVQGVDEPLEPRPGHPDGTSDGPDPDPLGQEPADQVLGGLGNRTGFRGRHEPSVAPAAPEPRGTRVGQAIAHHVGRSAPRAHRDRGQIVDWVTHPVRLRMCRQ